MKFLRISMQCFCSVAEASFPLAGRGMVAVCGENADAEAASSNGSGKSTLIVDSICWVLFGRTTKGGLADAVTPGGKGKGTSVTIEFERGGHTFVVTRYRKHKTHGNKLFVSQDGVEISKSTADDTDKLLESILGINYDTFLYTTVLAQGSLFRFSQLTDQNRKEILEGIANTDIYERARILARSQETVLAAQIDIKVREQEARARRMVDETAKLSQIMETVKTVEASYQSKLADADARTAAIRAELESARVALSQFVAAYPAPDLSVEQHLRPVESRALNAMMDANGKASVARAKLQNAERELKALDGLDATCNHCGSVLTEAHRVDERHRRSGNVAIAQGEVAAAVAAADSAHKMHARISAQIAEIQATARNYGLQISPLQQRVTQLEYALRDSEASRARITKDDLSSLVTQQQNTLDRLAKETEQKDQELSKDRKQRELASQWITGFQEIRITAIDGLMAFINDRLARYVKIMAGDDITVAMAHTDKGKIDLQVNTAGGSYLSASGGEKTKIDVAIAFALHDLASQCTNWASNLLVLDEIAVYLDATGVDRLMALVAEKLDRLETVFMVSHDPACEGYADSVMRVRKEGGVSRLVA